MAETTESSSSNMVRTRTPTPGAPARTARVASMPLRPVFGFAHYLDAGVGVEQGHQTLAEARVVVCDQNPDPGGTGVRGFGHGVPTLRRLRREPRGGRHRSHPPPPLPL